MNYIKGIIIAVLCIFVSGCSDNGPEVGIYKEAEMEMNFRKFFNGKVATWGMIQDWRGKVTSTFTVDINVTWKKNKGEMVEHFIFDDGRKLDRIWYVTDNEDGTYTANADDVVGEAIGIENGIAINFLYKLIVPNGESTITLKADDKMFMVAKDAVMNKTTLSKFGITVSRLTMFLKKEK